MTVGEGNLGSLAMRSTQNHSESATVPADLDAEAYLAAIVASSDDAIIGATLDGHIRAWNRGAERMFGYSTAEIRGQKVALLVPAELAGEEEEILARIRRGDSVAHYETIRIRRDGSRVIVSLSISPIRNDAGEIIGASKIARDITDQKKLLGTRDRMEAELAKVHSDLQQHAAKLEATVAERTAHLQRTIEELEGVSYSLSHDLRGPLRTIQGFVQLVLEDAGDRLAPDERELLGKAIKAAHRLDRLIQDVLTYTRVSRQSVVIETVDVERLLRQIIDERPELRSPRAQIDIASPLEPVRGHEASLTQVITNLLDNAVKFVPPERQPHIRVSSRLLGDKVDLWFEDNGIGIPAEAQGRLFAIFQRVHDDKKYPGTGIGLAIVRKAVERMGGTVRLESEVGKGTRFCVTLPKGRPS